MARPWHPIAIVESNEPLVELPAELLRWQPHPYVALGAPYGEGCDPFRLRHGVVQRLLQAQAQLQAEHPQLQLLIFDAFRPLAVQHFMVEYTRGLPGVSEAEVQALWAAPSRDPATPPPHSTGAAVDLTLASRTGEPLAMGGEIDAVGDIAKPLHFEAAAAGTLEAQFHLHRCWLAQAMASAGFARHPGEWWHFSWGDQLWAWSSGEPQACYGRAAQA